MTDAEIIKEADTEDFAEKHADQWQGCLQCKESHHESSFCKNCGRCFYHQKSETTDYGTFIYCECGQSDLWD